MNKVKYDKEFYLNQKDSSYRSAQIVLECLFSLYKPNSIADFGCGVGTWLKAAQELIGNDGEFIGVDGAWGGKEDLLPNFIEFYECDLTKPFQLPKKVDLAISVEVAEHLRAESAETIVDTIVGASDVIMFSAAIPGQGGVDHINEQYQSYWCKLFVERGYTCFDLLRPVIFNDAEVGVGYRQNTLVYVKTNSDAMRKFEGYEPANLRMIDIVHPGLLERVLTNGSKNSVLMKRLIKNILNGSRSH
ncbi:MAG: class I SAM-dependent methyltransferase [Pseudomonadota bacterium]|nr:class I SAM-dependent methyltransferase [Pseudomonadota bacterium]